MVVNNPNNWHWVNKNCLPWSKDYFEENLQDLELDNEEYLITITSTAVSGDCDVTQPKESEFKGTIKIPEFIHDETDYDYQLSNFGDHKAHVRKTFVPLIHAKLLKFQSDLIDSHSKDVQE
ncbi:unnamed protein product [Wickerhamomyces anomalus]